MKFLCLIFSCLALAGLGAAQAESPQQAAAEIDAVLARHWKAQNARGNAPLNDEGFARRIYLDLAGRIPTATEAVQFLDDTAPDKRAKLIERLLQQESYVSHFYNYWADVLRFKSKVINRAGAIEAAFSKYLKDSLRENKPYDQFVREMLSAKGYTWDNPAIGYYHRDPDMPLDNMAITSRIFLGTRIECAQCHDHPFDKWKQTDFYRLAAFTHANKSQMEAFDGVRDAMRAREKVIEQEFFAERKSAPDGGKAAEARKKERIAALDNRGVAGVIKGPVGQLFSPIGLSRDPKSLLKLPRDFHEPDGKPGDAIQPATIMGKSMSVSPGQDPAEVFAAWVTSPENPRFTKVIVNRMWQRMFGLPITEFSDDLKDATTPMVPELEAHLEKLMVAQRYDLKAFLAAIANTRAYQSVVAPDEFTPGSNYRFTGPLLRRMSAEQIWDSFVALANHEPDALDLQRAERDERRVAISHMAFDAYRNFDGNALLELAFSRLRAEKELEKRELDVRAAMVIAKRENNGAKVRELGRADGEISRERGQVAVDQFIMPMLNKLAQDKLGQDAAPIVDETYQVNPNPRILTTETWRRLYLPGYGPKPKTATEKAAQAQAETERLGSLAAKLGFTGTQKAEFVAYCEKARSEWLRASELDSPAPRGHFLRAMGQSDREFVENANPNAAIPQALLLMNSEVISERGILSPCSPLMCFVQRGRGARDEMDAVYLSLLARKPTEAERATWKNASGKGLSSSQDLIYALLNTKQFLFIQ